MGEEKEEVNSEAHQPRDSRVSDVAASQRDYEERFARSFILPERRDRFISLAADRQLPPKLDRKSMKRRGKFRSMLAGLEHWLALGQENVEYRASEPGEELLTALSGLGAPEDCYVLSESRAWDGRFGSLEEVIRVLPDEEVGSSLVVCLPESLAYYYHGEMADLSGILSKKNA